VSEPATPARPFYVTGGTLKPGERSYVERRADTDLFDSLLAGEFCYVLTARQMGKSSLMACTATRLEQAGVASAIVDLTQIGSERGAQGAAQWYFGIANEIHRRLKIAEPLRPWWQERSDLSSVQRLTDFFRELVLTHCPGRVVIFVDEIDSTIGLPFADDFFAALRACFNARATEPEFERLTFVLLGVATPDQLIQDPARTPFNIGKRIDLTDFSPDEARTLAPGLHSDTGEAYRRLERILYWTGGHPYLSQALCRAVRERGADSGTAEEAVDPQVGELFLSSRAQREETNLKHARARLEKPGAEGRRLLQLYRRVRQGKPVPDQPTSPLFAQLKLAGVVKAMDEGRIAVRNRVYETVFTQDWAKAAMPADRGRQFAAATLAASLASVLVWYAVFQPRPYEEAFRGGIKADAYNVAFDAYTHLRANPFSRSRATELMQKFWEHRALQYAQAGKRDESLLSYLRALTLQDSDRLRKRARNLLSGDYERLRFTLSHGELVTAVAFSPDGRTLATGTREGIVRFWNTSTGKRLAPAAQILKGVGIRALVLSPDEQVLFTGNADSLSSSVVIVDARSDQIRTPLARSLRFSTLAFNPNGKTAAILKNLNSDSVQLVDLLTGNITFNLKNNNLVTGMAFSSDGSALAIGSYDGSIQLFDTRTGKLTSALQSHIFISALAFSPDGQAFAIGSSDGNSHRISARTGEPIAPPLKYSSSVLAMAFSPDGKTLAVSYYDNTARLWGIPTRKALPPLQQQNDDIGPVLFKPDGQTLVVKHNEDSVQLFDAVTGSPLSPPLQSGPISFIGPISSNGRFLVIGHKDEAIRLWDMTTGKTLPPLPAKITRILAFSHDSQILAIASHGAIYIWDAAKGKLLSTLRFFFLGPIAAQFSPDDRTLAVVSPFGNVRLWDVVAGKPTMPSLEVSRVSALAFSPDGLSLATAQEDPRSWSSTIRLWNPVTGQPLTSPLPAGDISPTLAFSPNGKILLVVTDHWLNTYSWNGQEAVPLSTQLRHRAREEAFRFPSNCERCLQVALEDTGDSFHLETLHLDEPADPPIEGDPRKLLEKWQGRLGLKFDEQMRPVPAVDLPGESAGTLSSGRRSPRARPR
jgi:WD40 repeat protein